MSVISSEVPAEYETLPRDSYAICYRDRACTRVSPIKRGGGREKQARTERTEDDESLAGNRNLSSGIASANFPGERDREDGGSGRFFLQTEPFSLP